MCLIIVAARPAHRSSVYACLDSCRLPTKTTKRTAAAIAISLTTMSRAGCPYCETMTSICPPYRVARNASNVYLIIRPRERASRNFLTGYRIEPAANRNVSMGIGGGNRAGMAIATAAPSLEDLVYLFQVPRREPACECFLTPFASEAVCDEVLDSWSSVDVALLYIYPAPHGYEGEFLDRAMITWAKSSGQHRRAERHVGRQTTSTR